MLPPPLLRRRWRQAMRKFLPRLEAVAIGHAGQHRLPVEKTDDDDRSVLAAPGPARLAFHAMGGREIRRLGMPCERMGFVHAASSRRGLCGKNVSLTSGSFRQPSGEDPSSVGGKGPDNQQRARELSSVPAAGSESPCRDEARAPSGESRARHDDAQLAENDAGQTTRPIRLRP